MSEQRPFLLREGGDARLYIPLSWRVEGVRHDERVWDRVPRAVGGAGGWPMSDPSLTASAGRHLRPPGSVR